MVAKTPLLILSGPVGVGKTSIGHEVSTQLCDAKIAHTFVDFDALTQSFPRPADDPYGNRLGGQNLAALWERCRETGSRNVIVARVVETDEDVRLIAEAIPSSNVTVIQLHASDKTLRERVGKREIGSEHDWHVNRAIELARSLIHSGPADIVIDTEGRSISEVAKDIAARIDWR